MTSPTCIDPIASIAGRPNRLGTYRTGRPRSAAIRSACTSRVVKSSFPGRDCCASNADLAVPQSPVCGTPESTGFGTLAAKESHLMVQQADEHRAEDEGEHPIHERKHRGNFNGLSGKREGNHPDRGDQREHEQDRKKNESKENQKRLEVSKNRATSHAEASIPP